MASQREERQTDRQTQRQTDRQRGTEREGKEHNRTERTEAEEDVLGVSGKLEYPPEGTSILRHIQTCRASTLAKQVKELPEA